MAHDVFISHSAKDKSIADAVCATLEANGVRCFIAPRDIVPGAEWGEAIIDAINDCRLLIIIVSSNANASHQIKREVGRAVNRGAILIPFRIEDAPLSKSLEFFISTARWLDALTPPLEKHLLHLARQDERAGGERQAVWADEHAIRKRAAVSGRMPAPGSTRQRRERDPRAWPGSACRKRGAGLLAPPAANRRAEAEIAGRGKTIELQT